MAKEIREIIASHELLNAEFERLTKRYQELEFHKYLRVSAGVFKDTVMNLVVPQPESFRGRFNIPVVVFGQIPPEKQAELAGLNYFLGGLNVRDWEFDPKGWETPKTPYTTWMQDGKENLNRSVSVRDVRKTLEADERGATVYDGVALLIVNQSVLDDHYVDLPGTSVGSGYAPSLDRCDGRPEVYYYLTGYARPGFGSASCGRL